ncbi:MAG: glutaryl-CoA dehydrogenase [Syntrophus sp. SKADARSKE-3]|nr:glutaryl-CoA dehydrogenase [Syntrophus sp. SKADARSKE-3]
MSIIAKYQALDYLQIDDLLSEEEKILRNSVRKFVDEKALPLIDEHYEAGTFPVELGPEMGKLGLLGMDLEGYGCAGASNVEYGLACQELERGDSALRSFMSVQTSLCMFPIYTFGSEEQKQRWLPQMATGEKIGCFGLTEPDYGSDAANMRTSAKRDGKDWIINGSKMWITNGSVADIAIIWARTDDGINGFLIEKGTKGFQTELIKNKLSLRASVTSGLTFDSVRLPESSRLPLTRGLKSPLMCLSEARYGISWGAIGVAMDCYDRALRYVKSRVQYSNPIASFQMTQEKLVKMVVEITKMQLLSLRVGRLKDEGKCRYEQISLAKMNNVSEALKIARTARNMLGAYGISLEYGIMRHMCNLESVYTYEGTHEIQTLILGRDITGTGAFGT